MKLWKLGLCALTGCLSTLIAAQNFNVDSNNEFAAPELGGGAPSALFGGAANQPGYWDIFACQGQPDKALKNTAGVLTTVVMSAISGVGGLGYNNPINTGDYSALLNDGQQVPSSNWYEFHGLNVGTYDIFTYSVKAQGTVTSILVTVPGSISVNPQVVNGPMPGNQFALGITHCIHKISVSVGIIRIEVDRQLGMPVGLVNGFQIVQLSSYVAPTSYTVTQGLNFGGSLASIQMSDDDRASVLSDEFSSNGEFEFTSTLPTGTVSQLKFKFEGRASRSDLSQFLKMRNYSTGYYTNVNVQTATLSDSIAEGSITSGVANYFSASREVKERVLWIPQNDITAMDGWVESCDQAMWEMVF